MQAQKLLFRKPNLFKKFHQTNGQIDQPAANLSPTDWLAKRYWWALARPSKSFKHRFFSKNLWFFLKGDLIYYHQSSLILRPMDVWDFSFMNYCTLIQRNILYGFQTLWSWIVKKRWEMVVAFLKITDGAINVIRAFMKPTYKFLKIFRKLTHQTKQTTDRPNIIWAIPTQIKIFSNTGNN